jgi:hypothetical protein
MLYCGGSFKDMEKYMNHKEAQQLELRIQREAPQYRTSLEYETFVVGGDWGVKLVKKSTGDFLGIMEDEEAWDLFKQDLGLG